MQLETLHEAVARHAAERPEATALDADQRTVSYADLAARVEAIAAQRPGGPLPAHARVAVTAHKTPETIALILALGKLGHPALVLSPELGENAADAVIQRSGAAIRLAAAPCAVTGPGVAADAGPVAEAASGTPADTVQPDAETALLLTTSGTTGVPKAVRQSQRGVDRFFQWAQQFFGLAPGTRVLNYAPLNFDLSLLEVWATLYAGGTAILLDGTRGGDGAYLRDTVVRTRPEVIQAVPMFFSLLSEAAGAQDLPAGQGLLADGPRHVVLTGDAAGVDLRRRMVRLFPRARFHNVYGCTETNDSMALSCDPDSFASLDPLPVGRPLAGVDAKVVDPAGHELSGPGEGELLVSTPFQAHGYTDAERTAAAFETRDSDHGPRRFYRTGDRVARTEDDTFYLQGRTDLMVKVRGVRTNLQDVERAIGQHEQVAEAVVIPIPDEVVGNRLHAVVETRADTPPNTLDLRRHCAAHLPRTAVPARFIVSPDRLPRTSTGKPDRRRVAHAFSV
jgi:acyl-coenzyme A synthetase/AMP-(fatty) acid ligase